MKWCLSWWTPEGPSQVLLAVVFWAAVLAAVVLSVRRLRRSHRSATTGSPAELDLAGSGERGSR